PDQNQVLRETYPGLQKISIDYAVMEPASQSRSRADVVVVEMPVQWLDIGSWPALAETLTLDERDNAIDAAALVALDSDGNIIISRAGKDGAPSDHLLGLIGVSDMIVVHTADATLICPKRDAQRVKELVGKVKEKFGE